MRAIPWFDEPLDASLSLGFRLRLYAACVGLVLASVPFLHLYLEIDLSAAELAIHAVDISLGTLAVLVALEVAISIWQRSLLWQISAPGKILFCVIAAAIAFALLLQPFFHDWLPMAEEIRHKHVDAGYGDMSIRVLPVVALIGYLLFQSVREQLLRRELEELRALSPGLIRRLASAEQPEERVVLRHEGSDVVLDPSAITRVQAEENYCRICTAGADRERGDLLVRTTLAQTLAKLPADRFLQVHRSHVVGVAHVREVVRNGRQLELVLDSGDRVPVSRSRHRDVRDRLRATSGTLE